MIRSSFQQKRRDHVSYLGYLILTLIVLLSFTLILHTFLQANAIGIDFFVYWNSGKALFIENQNPYNDSITLLNQMGIRGRPSLPDEDQFAFVYPLYGLLAVLLTSFLSYDWAISFWLAFNILALCITLYLIFPKSAKLVSLSAFLFYPIFFGLVVGNFSSRVDASILLILGLIILREFRQPAIQVIAAALFAWATIKPQHIWLYLLFILAIAVRLKLWLFIKAFFAWLAGYLTFAFLALPDCPWHMSNNMKIYAQVLGNFVIHELLTSFVPGQIAGLLSALILISCLGMVLFQLHQWWQGKLHWIYAAAWVGLTHSWLTRTAQGKSNSPS